MAAPSTHAAQLVQNLPARYHALAASTGTPLAVDLVLEGGAFNGGFAAGAAVFLREMERARMIRVRRVSGCSIGAILGALWCLDMLEDCLDLYAEVGDTWRQTKTLPSAVQFRALLEPRLQRAWNASTESERDALVMRHFPPRRFWVTFSDAARGQAVVVSRFRHFAHLVDVLARSAWVPGASVQTATGGRYWDGIAAHVFDEHASARSSSSSAATAAAQLHLDPMLMGGLIPAARIRDERNVSTRVLVGMLDAFRFFESEPLPHAPHGLAMAAVHAWRLRWWSPNPSRMCAWSWPRPLLRGVWFRQWRWVTWSAARWMLHRVLLLLSWAWWHLARVAAPRHAATSADPPAAVTAVWRAAITLCTLHVHRVMDWALM